ncbi:DUF302 domain-containing protein [Rhodobacteraceae bacterium MYP1-1]|uniref:DUF302 domain-containing protein n=2 Tax=Halocynthiibacter styelae TaxID=2761955 RepID=A0A8J7LLE1_9RHOB|nr:DUF302 domain-containing protein [Paenihalocynthiibacter styelae]
MKHFALTLGVSLLMTTASFAENLVTRSSAYSVTETVDRLAAAVENAGAKVFARVDHAAGAASVGTDLRPTEMLMFGNPALGTPAMQLSQSAGLDLPLRVVVYEDAEGQVTMAWHAPSEFSTVHGLPEDAEVLTRMTGALNKLTAAAAGE